MLKQNDVGRARAPLVRPIPPWPEHRGGALAGAIDCIARHIATGKISEEAEKMERRISPPKNKKNT